MAPVSNMIDIFNRFKQLSVNQFKSTGTLFTPLQVMALNNIFFFSPSTATDYTIDLQDWEKVVNDCREKYQVYSMPDDVEYKMGFAIEKYSNMAYYSLTKIDEYVSTLKDSDMNKNVLRMLESISRRIYHNIDHTQTEDGFTLNIIDPIISAYFDNSIPLLQYQGSDYEMPESKVRKVAQARSENQDTSHVSGRKADRSALIDISNHEHKHTAYICEIKTEGTSKHRPDLPKIAAMLKDMLNEALKCNVSNQNYSVLGILIEGTQGTVLAMDLPYEKMYRLIELDIFNLPRSTKELRFLSSVVKPLLNMKELVKKNVSTMLPLQYSLSSTSSNHGIMTETNKSPTYYTDYYK
jgi:hypothetical protein